MIQKIGKQPGRGDEHGYFPDVFSASMNRALARHRQKGVEIDDDLIRSLYDHAAEVKARFIRRYEECK